jgi:hypothetical protein
MTEPITPPPELVQRWWNGTHGAFYEFEAVTTQAARWGADQELEACCEWLAQKTPETYISALRAARRKPPTLKEQALAVLDDAHRGDLGDDEMAIIRRPLEQLPDTH